MSHGYIKNERYFKVQKFQINGKSYKVTHGLFFRSKHGPYAAARKAWTPICNNIVGNQVANCNGIIQLQEIKKNKKNTQNYFIDDDDYKSDVFDSEIIDDYDQKTTNTNGKIYTYKAQRIPAKSSAYRPARKGGIVDFKWENKITSLNF